MRNRILSSYAVHFVFLFAGLWVGCEEKDPTPSTTAPTGLVTSTVSGITATEASVLCNVAGDGGETLISRGVVYSQTNSTPSETDGTQVLASGTDLGTYTVVLTGLSPNTKYYARSFAKNSVGYGFGSVKEFTTQDNGGPVSSVTDIDGNVYAAVTIGTQTWMKSNLKVKRLRTGGSMQSNLSNTQWQNTSSPSYAIYENQASNDDSFGKLYSWYAVNTGNLCPTGWHVPTDAEWTTLSDFLGGEGVAGGKMKSPSSLWTSPNVVASNSSGFSALPGGMRNGSNGIYGEINLYGNFWSSTSSSSNNARMRYIGNSSGSLFSGTYPKQSGFSVRCIKD